jgi:hypothetical protein
MCSVNDFGKASLNRDILIESYNAAKKKYEPPLGKRPAAG